MTSPTLQLYSSHLPAESNVLSCVEFSQCGGFVATGNRSGKIVVYKEAPSSSSSNSGSSRSSGNTNGGSIGSGPGDDDESSSPWSSPSHHDSLYTTAGPKPSGRKSTQSPAASPSKSAFKALPQIDSWHVHHQFISHDTEFDYLKSIELEPKINKIRFCRPVGLGCSTSCLLSTNDKCVKLWKVSNRSSAESVKYSSAAVASYNENKTLSLPTRTRSDNHSPRAWSRRVYKNAHVYHINSIDISSDGETFLSADDLRINLWDLDRSDTSLNVIDIKPDNMEDLQEVITAATFNPSDPQILAYSTSKGCIKLGDLRQACLCTAYSKVFEEPDDTGKSFFSEIIASISDVSFSRDGRYFSTRDYMTVRHWDIRMEKRCVKVVNIHEHLRPLLGDLYESDAICDKFELRYSGDGKKIITGSYSNQFSIRSVDSKTVHNFQVPSYAGSKHLLPPTPTPTKNKPPPSSPHDLSVAEMSSALDQQTEQQTPLREIRIPNHGEADVRADQKVANCAWHPDKDVVAVTSQCAVCIYSVAHL